MTKGDMKVFQVRLPVAQHAKLVRNKKATGTSINQQIVNSVEKTLSDSDPIQCILDSVRNNEKLTTETVKLLTQLVKLQK